MKKNYPSSGVVKIKKIVHIRSVWFCKNIRRINNYGVFMCIVTPAASCSLNENSEVHRPNFYQKKFFFLFNYASLNDLDFSDCGGNNVLKGV